MSNSSWKKPLTLALKNLAFRSNDHGQSSQLPRLAVIGIGNELNGDDAAGVQVIRRLRLLLPPDLKIMLVEAGPAPENFTGPIRHFQPDLVLLVDAVDAGEPVGKIVWLDWQDINGVSALTHGLPPTVFGKYLFQEMQRPVALLGIQAGSVEFDTPPSPAVKKAVRQLSRELAKILTDWIRF
ncbi:MAG: hydrogenase 3 maturation endopeptidase HyCI [Anaerolineae bacterium]|nr:hydrogenase 3 maturation endopeptidase HyCI [Anaerolineae bacterium]